MRVYLDEFLLIGMLMKGEFIKDLATPAMNGSRPFNVSEEVEKPHRRRRRRKRIEVLFFF